MYFQNIKKKKQEPALHRQRNKLRTKVGKVNEWFNFYILCNVWFIYCSNIQYIFVIIHTQGFWKLFFHTTVMTNVTFQEIIVIKWIFRIENRGYLNVWQETKILLNIMKKFVDKPFHSCKFFANTLTTVVD